jgi:DNA processing protein
MSNDQNFIAFVALGLIPRIGSKSLQLLLDAFQSPIGIINATSQELVAVSSIGKKIASQIQSVNLEYTARQIAAWESKNIRVLTWDSSAYPAMLRFIPDAPPILFIKGTWDTQITRTVAIVGTREPSPEAKSFTQLLGYSLADQHWTIVSGLARGIDIEAHQSALASIYNGQTVAVLGSGIDSIYPPEHKVVSRRILSNGAMCCEVAPHNKPSTPQLVARNRIISGLSQLLIVIEAGESSGALHAVRFAKAQNRLVATTLLPAAGNQQLIQQGALAIPPDLSGVDLVLQTLENLCP